jgi:hypothetical protein
MTLEEVEDRIDHLHDMIFDYNEIHLVREYCFLTNQIAKYEVYNENGWEYEFEDYEE